MNSWQSGQNIGRANLSVQQLTSWPPLETPWEIQKLCFPVSRYLFSAVNLTSGINQAQAGIQVPPRHTFSSKITVLGIYTGIFSNTRLSLKMFLLSVWERKQKNLISGGEPKTLPLLWSCPNPWTGQGGIKGPQDNAQSREPQRTGFISNRPSPYRNFMGSCQEHGLSSRCCPAA